MAVKSSWRAIVFPHFNCVVALTNEIDRLRCRFLTRIEDISEIAKVRLLIETDRQYGQLERMRCFAQILDFGGQDIRHIFAIAPYER